MPGGNVEGYFGPCLPSTKLDGGKYGHSQCLRPPMPTDAVYALRAPKVFMMAEVPNSKQLWRVDRALYSFRRSPRLWSTFRDARLRDAKFQLEGRSASLRQLKADENVWAVITNEVFGKETVEAYVNVYVDDILYVGSREAILATHDWLCQAFKSTPLSWAADEEGVRFLGLEIYQNGRGYRVAQQGYIKELLRHHGAQDGPGAKTPCPTQNGCLVRRTLSKRSTTRGLCGRPRRLQENSSGSVPKAGLTSCTPWRL